MIQWSNRNVLINIVDFAVSSIPSPELVRRKAVTPSTTELLKHCCRFVVKCLVFLEGLLQSGRTEQRNSLNPLSWKRVIFVFFSLLIALHSAGYSSRVSKLSPVLCCPLASTGIGEKKSICVRIHWCNEYPLPSVQFSPSSSCTMQKFSGQMAQARNYLNPVFKFSVLRYAGQYSVPSLLSCPMTWSTVQVFRMDSLYLLVYNIQNNKSVLPVFHPSFVINSLVSLSLCQCPCRAFLKTQWCLLLISMSFPILYHY